MFIEKSIGNNKSGWIEVITGAMFSGKTEELIRRLKRATIARQNVEVFKPAIDTRYSIDDIVSHDENAIRSTMVSSSGNILMLSSGTQVVGIDEAQFFDNGLPEVCNKLAEQGVRVIVAGLDMDFSGKPFGPMPALMAVAEYVTKVHAICTNCGALAQYSHRIHSEKKLVMLGEKDEYEALCRSCFNVAVKRM